MTRDSTGDPRTSGNNQAVGSVADIDIAIDFEDPSGETDQTNRGENPGDSGAVVGGGGGSENEDPSSSPGNLDNSAPRPFGDDPKDAFDSEALTG